MAQQQHQFAQTCLLISFFIVVFPLSANAGNIVVDNTLTRLELTTELDYLFDKQETISLNQVINNSDKLTWKTGVQYQKALLMPAGLYWIKGRISNPHKYPISITLETKPAAIDLVDLYMVDNHTRVTAAYNHAGQNNRFTDRPSIHRHLINTITIEPHSSTTLIWRVIDAPIFTFSATAWMPEHFLNKDQHMQLVYGMLYGTMLIMILYNLLLFVSTRERSYCYYILYIATAGYALAAEQGHIYSYLSINTVWPKFVVYTLVTMTNLVMFALFCSHFLQLKQHAIRLHRVIQTLAIIAAIAVLAAAISTNLIIASISLFAISALYITALTAGIRVRSQGIISAGYFIVAIMIVVFSVTATNMATLGLISTTSLTQSLSALGTTLMLVFFSLALAERIHLLQKENRQANVAIQKANHEKIKAINELATSQAERIKLEQSASRAKQESRAKNNFLATLSHEIRTPMSAILGMTELVKSTTLDEQQKHYLDTVEQSGHTLLSIIEDLQDYAKIEAGQITSELTSFNLEALLDNCISTFTPKATEKGLRFVTDLDPNIDPVLRGDATKLQQIISNLLNNAFKFTDTGSVILSVHPTERSGINCIELKFSIQDSGIGLTEQEQHRLFYPFQHADQTTYGRYGGSGLGLAISKQLTELMDGQIGVHSIPGKGSCFWFTARLMIDNNPPSVLLREKSPHLARQLLLLVDSSALTTDIIKRLLISWKMEVHHATSIERAYSLLLTAQSEDNPYSIVLCNFELLDGNAKTLAKQIQQSEQLSAPHFIVMANNEEIPQQKNLAHTGINQLLEQPITFERLHNVLKYAITAPKTPQTNTSKTQTCNNIARKVLLVEDNPVNQMVLTGLLSNLGIKPAIATDGRQAIDMQQADHYDLIFMDCEMPIMDGYEATRFIRAAEEKYQASPVTIIALSAHASEQHQQQALLAGMNDYLIKPVSVDSLRTAINTVLYSSPQ